MQRLRAAWVVPVAGPPVENGWLTLDEGTIIGVGQGTPVDGSAAVVDCGRVALLPGLVNAHTHLELSHLRGTLPPTGDFVGWIRGVIRARAAPTDPDTVLAAVSVAIAEAERHGTALVGDISNTLSSYEPLARSALSGVVFHELLGFTATEASEAAARVQQALARARSRREGLASTSVRLSLAAHAPYSVAPALFDAIRRAHDASDSRAPRSVHLAESRAESELVATGTGPCRQLLEDLGAWSPEWTAPGGTPIDYLDSMGWLDDQVLAVHFVHASGPDLDRLASRGVTCVTCPRSNRLTGAGVPPLAEAYARGVRIAIGTDSLVTVPDLNVFAELAEARALAPDVPAATLLDSATRQGAVALGFGDELGTFEPGRRAAVLAVRIPDGIVDVEEYLVSGVPPDTVSWVRTGP